MYWHVIMLLEFGTVLPCFANHALSPRGLSEASRIRLPAPSISGTGPGHPVCSYGTFFAYLLSSPHIRKIVCYLQSLPHIRDPPGGLRCHSFRLVAFLSRHSSPATGFKSLLFKLLRTLLQSCKTQLFYFQAIPDSFAKTPRVGGGTWGCASHSETPSGASRPLVTRRRISRSKILHDPVPARRNSLSLQSFSRSARSFPANPRPQG